MQPLHSVCDRDTPLIMAGLEGKALLRWRQLEFALGSCFLSLTEIKEEKDDEMQEKTV